MKVNFKDNDKDYENKDKYSIVTNNTDFKDVILQYVGMKLNPEDNNVTIEMILDICKDEFPEFLLVLSEENYFRGYEQALSDMHDHTCTCCRKN